MVVIEGGFERAARRLHLTQSAVSQRVRQLEEQYGCILLKRTTPPEPTLQGQPLLTHYRQVAQLEADLGATGVEVSSPAFQSLAIGINADSLATWFFAAVEPLLASENLVLDLHVDDQELTHQLLQDGKVWGCISTRSQPLQGCRTRQLGTMRYGAFAAPSFVAKWFPEGFTLAAIESAPMITYNRSDDLNRRMFDRIFARQPLNPPSFFVPSVEMYSQFISAGTCYGMLPEQQSGPLLASGRLIDLCPSARIDVSLYWHCWNLRSATMDRFDQQLLQSARRLLRQ